MHYKCCKSGKEGYSGRYVLGGRGPGNWGKASGAPPVHFSKESLYTHATDLLNVFYKTLQIQNSHDHSRIRWAVFAAAGFHGAHGAELQLRLTRTPTAMCEVYEGHEGTGASQMCAGICGMTRGGHDCKGTP
jgi:hypothetical protein